MANPNDSQLIRFGVFEVDTRTGELRKSGARVKLQQQPFQILVILLRRPGEIVTREELRQQLWPADTFVDFDHSLNAAIKRLRDALGESAENPIYIETLARRGYRFNAPVQAVPALESAARISRSPSPLPKVALRGLVAGALAILLVGAMVWARRDHRGSGERRIESLAVLPLENLSRNPDQEYLEAALQGHHEEPSRNFPRVECGCCHRRLCPSRWQPRSH